MLGVIGRRFSAAGGLSLVLIAAGVVGQHRPQFDYDRKDVMPRDGEDTRRIVSADFDGDGDLDVFMANVGVARLLLNLGQRFVEGAFPLIQDVHRAAAVGDVDGDGDIDIVVGSTPGSEAAFPEAREKWSNRGVAAPSFNPSDPFI